MSTGNVFNSQSDLCLETLLSVFLFERPKLQMIVLIFRALFHVKESKDPEKTQGSLSKSPSTRVLDL